MRAWEYECEGASGYQITVREQRGKGEKVRVEEEGQGKNN